MLQIDSSQLERIRNHIGKQTVNRPIPSTLPGLGDLWLLHFKPAHPLSPLHFQ